MIQSDHNSLFHISILVLHWYGLHWSADNPSPHNFDANNGSQSLQQDQGNRGLTGIYGAKFSLHWLFNRSYHLHQARVRQMRVSKIGKYKFGYFESSVRAISPPISSAISALQSWHPGTSGHIKSRPSASAIAGSEPPSAKRRYITRNLNSRLICGG